MMLEVQVGGNT
ncbi:Protein of unknown function [Bacillus mobilis]|nr:Protein of unknown function [Bacillus mobilis]